MARLLLVGESWTVETIHRKGFDHFTSAFYEQGADAFVSALKAAGHEIEWMPSHIAQTSFPMSVSELSEWDVVILSDVGSNSLLLSPETYLHGQRTANRLEVIRQWVAAGNGLAMAGGYFSFQGIDGRARYRGTPIEEVLPVGISPYDDRAETPQGAQPAVVNAIHPITDSLPKDWPYLLGYNRVTADRESEVLALVDDDPLLVVGTYGDGRTLAWTSDIAPHWCPAPFLEWSGYARLWDAAMSWLAGTSDTRATP